MTFIAKDQIACSFKDYDTAVMQNLTSIFKMDSSIVPAPSQNTDRVDSSKKGLSTCILKFYFFYPFLFIFSFS